MICAWPEKLRLASRRRINAQGQTLQHSACIATCFLSVVVAITALVLPHPQLLLAAPDDALRFSKESGELAVIDLIGNSEELGRLEEASPDLRHRQIRTIRVVKDTKTLLVCADHLDLTSSFFVRLFSESVTEGNAIRAVFVADTISLGDYTILGTDDVTTPPGRRFDLVIVARRLIFSEKGALRISCCTPSRPRTRVDQRLSFRGGRAKIACESVEFRGETHTPSILTTKVRSQRRFKLQGDGGEFTGTVPDCLVSIDREPQATPVDTDPSPELDIITEFSRVSGLGCGRELAIWQLMMYDHWEAEIRQAQLKGDVKRIGEALRRLQSMPEFPTAVAYREQLNNRLKTACSFVDDFRLQPWTLSMTTKEGDVRTVDLFLEGGRTGLKVWLIPKLLLLNPRRVDGRRVYGLLKYDQAQPDEGQLIFDLKLAIDPRLSEQARTELSKTGEKLSGLFSNWSVKARNPSLLGIKGIDTALSSDSLQVSLDLELSRASAVLWRLSSDAGLPLDFDWTYERDRSIKSQQPLTLSVSRARRAEHDCVIREGKLYNSGKIPWTVQFLQAGPSRFYTPRDGRARVLKPKESLPLTEFGVAPDVSVSGMTIPPEAVAADVDPFSFDEFSLAEGLIDRIRVVNRLPAFDNQRQTQLKFVSARLVQTIGDGRETIETATEYRKLAPRDATGSEVSFWFIRPRSGAVKYRIEGYVQYEGAGDARDSLKPRSFRGDRIEINDKLLP